MPGVNFRLDGAGANRSVNKTSDTKKTTVVLSFGSLSDLNNQALTTKTASSKAATTGSTSRGSAYTYPGLSSISDKPTVGSKSTIEYTKDDPGDAGERARYKALDPTVVPLPPAKPGEYDWNLPPHKWSLPTLPTVVNSKHYEDNGFSPKRASTDAYRRGRLWWKANPKIAYLDSNGNATNVSVGDANRKYGFQFLWNPETFGTEVSVQLAATPSVQDRFLGVTGAFPATQTISFTVRVDRTNDFACAATLLPNRNNIVRTRGTATNSFFIADVEEFKRFYTHKDSFGVTDKSNKMSKKLIDLFQRGTIADIEYLFRAINGPGPSGASDNTEWMNGRGVKTADIGWLMPTLLHVDIGPLAYEGYVTALNVNHIAFTPNMTPIRSDVTVSINLLATASLTTLQPGASTTSSTRSAAAPGPRFTSADAARLAAGIR